MEQQIFSVLLQDLSCSSNLIMFPRIMNISGEKIHHLATFWSFSLHFSMGDFPSLLQTRGPIRFSWDLSKQTSPQSRLFAGIQTVTEMAPLDSISTGERTSSTDTIKTYPPENYITYPTLGSSETHLQNAFKRGYVSSQEGIHPGKLTNLPWKLDGRNVTCPLSGSCQGTCQLLGRVKLEL